MTVCEVDMTPPPPKRPRLAERARLFAQQRDTVAQQWQTVNEANEKLSRTCLYCEFLAQSRTTLKTHLRYRHRIGNK